MEEARNLQALDQVRGDEKQGVAFIHRCGSRKACKEERDADGCVKKLALQFSNFPCIGSYSGKKANMLILFLFFFL